MLFNGIHRRMNHALLVRKRWNSIGTPMPYARLCALDENLSSSVVQDSVIQTLYRICLYRMPPNSNRLCH